MSTSKVDICNLALSHIGGGKIVGLTDRTETARLANLHYDRCVKTVLRDFPWNFSKSIGALAVFDKTVPGYNHVYLYPEDCLKVLRVFPENYARDTSEKFDYQVFSDGQNKMIATDVEGALIEYTLYMPEPDLYDELFIEALSYKLASEINPSKTGNAQKSQEMMQRYQLALNSAQRSSAVEDHRPIEYPSRYLDARGGRVTKGSWGRRL